MAAKIQNGREQWTIFRIVTITQKLYNIFWRSIAYSRGCLIGLKIKIGKIPYFKPIWLPKFEMAGKVKSIHQKNCFYSKIMEQILMFNRLFKEYFHWAEKKAKKHAFLLIWPPMLKIADKVKRSFKSFYNSRIMQPISMFYSLFERYLDWAKFYNFRKFYIL